MHLSVCAREGLTPVASIPPTYQRDNVGTIEDGILAASWSPDEEILSIITGMH